jgi:GH35 family endo-1,4-beta-xylanase
MAKVFDIALDTDGELLFKDGDYAIEESTEQHMEALIIAEKGEYKATPLVGVGIKTFLNDDIVYSDDLKRAISEELETDGMTIEDLNINDIDNIKITAEYEV